MDIRRILVVDDSDTLRMVVRGFLEELPRVEIFEAEDGLAAIDLLQTATFDLIITDLSMPQLDGISFIQQARRITQSETTTIIVMSANEDEDTLERSFKAGAVAQIPKPFTGAEFLAVLARFGFR